MISWVPKKKINHELVKELLHKSEALNQFTNGSPIVSLLEENVREKLNIDDTKAVVCVSNGTVALWASVAAIEIYHNKDLQFSTQAFTFPASAQGYLDNVLIVDVDNCGGINLDLIDISTCDGIIVTNVFGNVVDISKYEKWCSENSKFLIFDNAATSNTIYRGKNSCNYGNASTVSFHHTKPIGFGEGGCIIIDSIYEKSLRNVLNFGIDNNSPTGKWHRKGGNYKMSDLQAVYILQYLENFDSIINKTRDIYAYFLNRIAAFPNIKTYPNFSDDTPFISCISIFIDNSIIIAEKLLANDVYSRKYYNPLIPCPKSTEVYNNILCISCTVDMTYSDIDKIVRLITE